MYGHVAAIAVVGGGGPGAVMFARTGVEGLDVHLGGGFPSGSTILLLSTGGNAAQILAEQLVATGLETGETVLYYNLERPRSEALPRIEARVADPAKRPLLQYFDCYAVRLRQLDLDTLGRIGVQNHAPDVTTDLLARVLSLPRERPFRVVLDSLTEAMEAYGVEAVLGMLKSLAGVIKMLGGIAVVLLEKGMFEPGVEQRVRHMVDGVIEFDTERQGFGLYSFISVTKMRGVNDATRLMLYKETDKGLWIETTRRVF